MQTKAMRVARALQRWIYPAFCLHCENQLSHPARLLCFECSSLLAWVNEEKRCRFCTAPLKGGHCLTCKERRVFLQPHCSLFSPIGPIGDVWRFFERRREEESAQSWAAFCLLRLRKVKWPVIDVIVPLPDSRTKSWSQNAQCSVLVAKELQKLIGASLQQALVRSLEDHLTLRKRGVDLCDRNVLLIAPEITENRPLIDARRVLKGAFPAAIYSLACMDSR